MEISFLKNMIPKIKHSLDELNGRMEMTGQSVNVNVSQ